MPLDAFIIWLKDKQVEEDLAENFGMAWEERFGLSKKKSLQDWRDQFQDWIRYHR